MMKYAESVLRGRLAETIVSEMLQEAGYFFHRFGYAGFFKVSLREGCRR